MIAAAPEVFEINRFRSFNCHLLQTENGLTLIDTGLPGSASVIRRVASRLGQEITHIFITHAHLDHVGSLDAVAELFPRAKTIASARTAAFLKGDRPKAEGGQKLRGTFATCKRRIDIEIEDAQMIAGFRAIFTPGHTPDHVSYLQEDMGYVFTGDCFISEGGRLAVTSEFRMLFPFSYLATWNKAAALQSARRLRDLKPKALFPAHGKAIVGPALALDKAIQHAE